MAVPEVAESFTGEVSRVTIGATKDSGGTRTSTVTVGGARNVVYGGVPYDKAVFDASMQGKTVFELEKNSPAFVAVGKIFEDKLKLNPV